MTKLPRFFTGIQATGTLTLGNYCGLIAHILKLQKSHEVIIMIADLHALTVPKQDFDYAQKSYEMAALLYACGLDQNCKIFIQSQVKGHLELAWLLAPFVTISELNNMVQYKDKKKKQGTGNLALLAYPILMAADILLYDADLVVVGQDQKQHLELTTDIAKKFCNFYSKDIVFAKPDQTNTEKKPFLKIPQFTIPSVGAKIKGLKNPQKKMSKSENDYIGLLEDSTTVEAKINEAKTDSENELYYDPHNQEKEWVANLLTICALLQDKKISEVEKEMEINKLNYSQFKEKVAQIINQKLALIQQKYKQLLPNIKKTLTENGVYLRSLAEQKMRQMRKELQLAQSV